MGSPNSPGRNWVAPNGRAIGLCAVLLAMWYAGASQSNSAAYLICFVLTSLAVVAWIHTWANLRGVQIEVGKMLPSFAGEEVIVPLILRSTRGRFHFAVQVSTPGATQWANFSEIDPQGSAPADLRFTGAQRGFHRSLDLRLTSSYPLGFFTARRRTTVNYSYVIYPTPVGSAPLPWSAAPTRQPRSGARAEGDDFGGLRAWRTGESQRRIDWKSVARGQPLMTKEWAGEADQILRFDWETLPSLGTEARLSQLARWIVLAERGTATYALRLPGQSIPASRGERHFHQCLRALAAFDGPTTVATT